MTKTLSKCQFIHLVKRAQGKVPQARKGETTQLPIEIMTTRSFHIGQRRLIYQEVMYQPTLLQGAIKNKYSRTMVI
mgnify:CR=1 FL=1